jgi:hypothetical protein
LPPLYAGPGRLAILAGSVEEGPAEEPGVHSSA